MRFFFLATTALALCLPVVAQAQPVTGFYIAGGAGANSLMDDSGKLGGRIGNLLGEAGLSREIRQQWDWGWAGVGSIGYGFGNGLRLEVEGNYRRNDNDRLTIAGYRLPQSGGHRSTYGVMANTFYDFDLTSVGISSRAVMPYLGVGLGYVWVNDDNISASLQASVPASLRTSSDVLNVLNRLNIDASALNQTAGVNVRRDGTEGRFAYQGIAGLAFPINWVPGLSLTTEYRFFGTTEVRARTSATAFAGSRSTTISSGNFGYSNFNHSILVGLRYAFNQPAPAPVPVPPPTQAATPGSARTYLVFFDWDSAELTAKAQSVIADAARYSRNGGISRLEVSGHADRSGTPAYNQAISRRRAEAVAGSLMREGVSRSDITVQAFGESRPLVSTADGVREPQNRRVEIVLR